MSNQGTIVQINGAVVDADFSQAEKLPAIYNALEVTYELYGDQTTLVLEVQAHLGDGWVRAVAMTTTDGLRRGMPIVYSVSPITVPLGAGLLGRIFNVTGVGVEE
jgi:F-type H+-transporting ATPase subunit beta